MAFREFRKNLLPAILGGLSTFGVIRYGGRNPPTTLEFGNNYSAANSTAELTIQNITSAQTEAVLPLNTSTTATPLLEPYIAITVSKRMPKATQSLVGPDAAYNRQSRPSSLTSVTAMLRLAWLLLPVLLNNGFIGVLIGVLISVPICISFLYTAFHRPDVQVFGPSIKEIADSMVNLVLNVRRPVSIEVGNLQIQLRQREDLIDTLYEGIEAIEDHNFQKVQGLKDLAISIQHSRITVVDHPFPSKHNAELALRDGAIEQLFKETETLKSDVSSLNNAASRRCVQHRNEIIEIEERNQERVHPDLVHSRAETNASRLRSEHFERTAANLKRDFEVYRTQTKEQAEESVATIKGLQEKNILLLASKEKSLQRFVDVEKDLKHQLRILKEGKATLESQSQAQINSLADQNAKLEKSNVYLRHCIERRDVRIACLRNSMVKLENAEAMQALQDEVQELKTTLQITKTESEQVLTEASQKLSSALRKNEQLRLDSEQVVAKANEKLSSALQEKEQLQRAGTSAEASKAKQVQRLEAELSAATSAEASKVQQVKRLEAELSAATFAEASKVQQVKRLEAELATATGQLASLGEAESRMRAKLEIMTAQENQGIQISEQAPHEVSEQGMKTAPLDKPVYPTSNDKSAAGQHEQSHGAPENAPPQDPSQGLAAGQNSQSVEFNERATHQDTEMEIESQEITNVDEDMQDGEVAMPVFSDYDVFDWDQIPDGQLASWVGLGDFNDWDLAQVVHNEDHPTQITEDRASSLPPWQSHAVPTSEARAPIMTAEEYTNIDPLLRPVQEMVENDAHQAQEADADAEADFDAGQLKAWAEAIDDFWDTPFAADEEAKDNDQPQDVTDGPSHEEEVENQAQLASIFGETQGRVILKPKSRVKKSTNDAARDQGQTPSGSTSQPAPPPPQQSSTLSSIMAALGDPDRAEEHLRDVPPSVFSDALISQTTEELERAAAPSPQPGQSAQSASQSSKPGSAPQEQEQSKTS